MKLVNGECVEVAAEYHWGSGCARRYVMGDGSECGRSAEKPASPTKDLSDAPPPTSDVLGV